MMPLSMPLHRGKSRQLETGSVGATFPLGTDHIFVQAIRTASQILATTYLNHIHTSARRKAKRGSVKPGPFLPDYRNLLFIPIHFLGILLTWNEHSSDETVYMSRSGYPRYVRSGPGKTP